MKKNMKKLTAMTLAAAMTMSLQAGTFAASAEEETVTLTIWNTEVLTPGIQTTEVAKVIEEKLGIKMDIIQGDAQKFSLLTAGGDLPDIIYTNPAQQNVTAQQLLNSGSVIALDDLLEEYGQNVVTNFPERLNYSRESMSNGDGKVYFIPVLAYEEDAEHPNISYTIDSLGLMTRWDVYKAIGCPEIETTDDYLNALKEMQDYANENDLCSGAQIWAISGWSDWGIWPWYVANLPEMGYVGIQYGIMNVETEEVERLYTSDAFWECLKFYNKAYNMGILDPDAFTMKNDQFWEKCQNGQVLMAYASWQTDYINMHLEANVNADWGYEKLPSDGYKYVYGITTADAPIGSGSDYATAITTNCEHPEKAMQLIDFLNSEEGARLLYSGVEGVHWTNEDGVVQPTEEYLANCKADNNYANTVGVNIYNKLCGFKNIAVLSDGYPADLAKSAEQISTDIRAIDEDYCAYYSEQDGADYSYPGEVLYGKLQNGEIETYTNGVLLTSFAPTPTEETSQIVAQCDQYVNVQAVEAIMSASDEEFEEIKAETLEGLTNKGYDDIVDELNDIYAQARATAEKFNIE